MPSFNGTSSIKKNTDPVQSLYLDVCLTSMGAVWRDCVYATPIQNLGGLNLKVVHLEMLNIVIASRTWDSLWCRWTITMHCDNLRVVFVVKTGKTKDTFLALCVRNIWLLTAYHGIDLQISHVPGCHNSISEAVSRIYSNSTVNNNILKELRDRIYGNTYPVPILTWIPICNFKFEPSGKTLAFHRHVLCYNYW